MPAGRMADEKTPPETAGFLFAHPEGAAG